MWNVWRAGLGQEKRRNEDERKGRVEGGKGKIQCGAMYQEGKEGVQKRKESERGVCFWKMQRRVGVATEGEKKIKQQRRRGSNGQADRRKRERLRAKEEREGKGHQSAAKRPSANAPTDDQPAIVDLLTPLDVPPLPLEPVSLAPPAALVDVELSDEPSAQ